VKVFVPLKGDQNSRLHHGLKFLLSADRQELSGFYVSGRK
jgi:hypothetical protein